MQMDESMKETSLSQLCKKVSRIQLHHHEQVRILGKIFLKCLERDPKNTVKYVHEATMKILFDPHLMKFFDMKEETFFTWLKIVKKISKHYYKKKTLFIEKVIERSYKEVESVLRHNENHRQPLHSLIFVMLSQNKVNKIELLIDIGDLLFNSFKEPSVFPGACLLFKTLYLKLKPDDFKELYIRVVPTFYSCLLKICRESYNKQEIMATLKIIEFFKLISYDEFMSFEGVLISTIQERMLEINETLNNTSPIELLTLSSRQAENEPDEFCISKLSPSTENIMAAIDYLLSINYFIPVVQPNLCALVQESIIFDLIC